MQTETDTAATGPLPVPAPGGRTPPSETRQQLDAARIRFDRATRFDRLGRHVPQRSCNQPDRRPARDLQGLIIPGTVDLYPCHEPECEQCAELRRHCRYTRRIGKIIRQIEMSNRTWVDTKTYNYDRLRRHLTDRGIDHQHWTERQLAQYARQCMNKRIRRKGGAKFKQGTAWELHKGERLHQGGTGTNTGKWHGHQLIHETQGAICHAQIAAASHIMPHGMAYPRRRNGEGNHLYWSRVVYGELRKGSTQRHERWNAIADGAIPWTPREGLVPGHRRWVYLADDPSPEAQLERLRLPFQPGNLNCRTIKGAKQGAIYAAKNARYTAKEGGPWSQSPRYGEPPNPSQDGTLHQGVGDRDASQSPDNPDLDRSGVNSPYFCQEEGPCGANKPPDTPPATGPPTETPSPGFDVWHQPTSMHDKIRQMDRLHGPPVLPAFRHAFQPKRESMHDERIFGPRRPK